MAALPYMQLYVADYLADTMHLDAEEHGAYLLLLMNYWQTGKMLPDDDRKLARIARTTDERWLSVRSTIVQFFDVSVGGWLHKRVEKDLEKVRSKSIAASKGGKASAKSRQKTILKTNTCNERSIYVEQNSNHTDTDTDTDTEKKERESARKRATRLSSDFVLPDEWKQYAIKNGLTSAEAETLGNEMRDWSISDKKGTSINWEVTYQRWVSRHKSYTPPITYHKTQKPLALPEDDSLDFTLNLIKQIGPDAYNSWFTNHEKPCIIKNGNGIKIKAENEFKANQIRDRFGENLNSLGEKWELKI